MERTRNRRDVPTRKSVGRREVERMLMVCLRSQTVFDQATGRLDGDKLEAAGYMPFAIAWDAAQNLAEISGGLIPPNFDAMDAEVGKLVDDNEELLSRGDIETLEEFLEYTFDAEQPNKDEERNAVRSLQRFLEDHVKDKVASVSSGRYPIDMPEMLQACYDELQDLASIEAAPSAKPFPDDFDVEEAVINKRSTGIEFFDRFMGSDGAEGGDASGEVIAFCGPYGSCKTTIATMLAVESCLRDQATYGIDNPDLPLTFFFSWEDEMSSLRPRLLSYAADIRRANLESGTLSRPGKLHPYEQRRESQAKKKQDDPEYKYPSEIERARCYAEALNRNLRVIDFSGENLDYRVHAGNMEEGIAAVIKHQLRQEGKQRVGRVIIDYAGAAAKEYCTQKNLDMSRELRHKLGYFPLGLKRRVAVPFDCSVWLMHQLGTDANSRAVGVVPKITDMAEARNFMENCNYGFAVGKSSLQRLCILTCLKHRRTEPKPNRIVRIDGDFCRVVDATDRYRVVGTSIVDASEAQRVRSSNLDAAGAAEAEAALSLTRQMMI